MEARLQIGDERVLVPGDWLAWAYSARSGWSWQGDTLVRELRFRDFDDGMRFRSGSEPRITSDIRTCPSSPTASA